MARSVFTCFTGDPAVLGVRALGDKHLSLPPKSNLPSTAQRVCALFNKDASSLRQKSTHRDSPKSLPCESVQGRFIESGAHQPGESREPEIVETRRAVLHAAGYDSAAGRLVTGRFTTLLPPRFASQFFLHGLSPVTYFRLLSCNLRLTQPATELFGFEPAGITD